MDCINDAILVEEPHLIPPFLWVAVGVSGVVIVQEVSVPDVLVKGRMQRCIHDESWEIRHFEYVFELLWVDVRYAMKLGLICVRLFG